MMRMYMGVLGEETPHVVVGSMRLAGFWITNVINMDGRLMVADSQCIYYIVIHAVCSLRNPSLQVCGLWVQIRVESAECFP